MTNKQDLYPLFKPNLTLSADEGRAIAGALQDIAESDGLREEEMALIATLIDDLTVELGDEGGPPAKVAPKDLARTVVDPEIRTLALQAAVMLMMADGKVTQKERARVLEYAEALGYDQSSFAKLEETVVSWVKSGDASPLFS
jgi:tellurite resistance protein